MQWAGIQNDAQIGFNDKACASPRLKCLSCLNWKQLALISYNMSVPLFCFKMYTS